MSAHSVDRERWAHLTIFEQMGNISSEVGRSLAARRRGDHEASEAAVMRAIDLFDATSEVAIKDKSHRTKEVLRAKEQYLSLFYGDTVAREQDEVGLERYFMQFAMAARLDR